MRKFFIVLFLCVLSTVAFGADDCVESPYDGKTYCCNVREKNLPDGAINKSWAEVIPWDRYYGTVRKCVGGRMTNDQFGGETDGVSPNLRKIREEASKYKIAYYTKFDGVYWYDPVCREQTYGTFATAYDRDTGGCNFEGLLDVGDKFYKCGEFRVYNAEEYITETTGKSVLFINIGDFVRRVPNSYGQYAIYECGDESVWRGVPFCTESDMPTDTELQSGVLKHLDEGWLMVTDMGDKVSLQGYEWGYDHEGRGEEYHYLECWTRGTAEDVQTKETQKKYNYKSCSSDSDCAGIDNKKSPYLHSTAWKCIEQTAGVRVCAAKECESGWEPKNGYCQEKNSGPAAAEKSAKPVNGQTGTPAGAATSRSAGAKTCPDANMDADCRCTRVPETVERGGVCVCADSNKEIKNGKCEYTAGYVAKLGADVNNAYDGVKSIVDGLKLNVWRDAEGNFNTARLASDSIAGVVLGTVGGIVTANVVKKSQVKKGFEDIQCHIGGQSVANFGDGFIVGR